MDCQFKQPSKNHGTSKYGNSLSINDTNHETELEPTMDFQKIKSSYYQFICRNPNKGNYRTSIASQSQAAAQYLMSPVSLGKAGMSFINAGSLPIDSVSENEIFSINPMSSKPALILNQFDSLQKNQIVKTSAIKRKSAASSNGHRSRRQGRSNLRLG